MEIELKLEVLLEKLRKITNKEIVLEEVSTDEAFDDMVQDDNDPQSNQTITHHMHTMHTYTPRVSEVKKYKKLDGWGIIRRKKNNI